MSDFTPEIQRLLLTTTQIERLQTDEMAWTACHALITPAHRLRCLAIFTASEDGEWLSNSLLVAYGAPVLESAATNGI